MMQVLEHAWFILASMGALIVISAFFSSAETAVFNLGPSDLRFLDPNVRQRLERMLRGRAALLVTILLANLIVNILYFNLGAVLSIRFVGAGQLEAAALTPVFVLVSLVLASEVVPKVVAVQWPTKVARLASAPLLLIERILRVPRIVLSAFADLLTRLIVGSRREEGELTPEDIGAFIEASAQEGHLAPDEYEWLQSVILLSRVEVREIMTPRVAIVACPVDALPETFLDLVRRHRHNKVPIYQQSIDHIEGFVDVKDVLASEGGDFRAHVQAVTFVPETAPVALVMERLTREGARLLVAVDEYGGTAGLLTHEDLVEAVIGDLADESDAPIPPVIRLGAGRFNVDADMGIRDLGRLIGRSTYELPVRTVGGLVMALLDRIPVPGDTVQFGKVTLEVISVRARRPVRIEMRLEQRTSGP